MLDSRFLFYCGDIGEISPLCLQSKIRVYAYQNIYKGGIFMKKTTIMSLVTSVAATAILAAASIPLGAGAVWKQVDRMGDLNLDGAVNVADLVTLSKHLHGKEKLSSKSLYNIGYSYYEIDRTDDMSTFSGTKIKNGRGNIQKADINQDGVIDVFDFVELRKIVISPNAKGNIYRWYQETTTTTTTTTTTITTTTTQPVKEFIKAPVNGMYGSLPSQGTPNLLIFYVDFPDCKFSYEPTTDRIEEIAFGPENRSSRMYPFESFTAFYSRASKGDMKLGGKAYRYTASEPIANYQGDVYKSKFATEVIKNMNSVVDYSKFDYDGDKNVDAILFCVPSSADENDWWPCAGGYYGEAWLKVDGMSIGHIITGNAAIVSDNDYTNFISTYLHEMGHCMGLPDYYLYNVEDYEGLHGSAGYDLMDEAYSDFSSISKLMLGWYTKEQIQVYDSSKGTQTFTLTNGQTDEGSCLIIPRGTLDGNYKSEYFILEYTTLDNNNSQVKSHFWWRPTGSGVRLLHVNTTETFDGWRKYFLYESGNDDATNKNAGIRYVRLVDDGDKDNLLQTGSVVDNRVSGFAWYDSSGNQSIDPGVIITIEDKVGDAYIVTVAPKY
jgi:M6 family metalloprotease-like protein